MLIISQSTVGKHFRKLEVGEVVKSYDQNLSVYTGTWETTTYKSSENYKVPFGFNYRRPQNPIAFLIIFPKYLKRKIGILKWNIGKILWKCGIRRKNK